MTRKPSIRKLRSAISSGTHVLAGIDHRSALMRRFSDLMDQHIEDLGGDRNISQSERVLVRKCAVLVLMTELMEQRFAESNGEASSHLLRDYQTTVNTLTRTLGMLGLERRAKDVTPTLGDMLRDDLRRQRERQP